MKNNKEIGDIEDIKNIRVYNPKKIGFFGRVRGKKPLTYSHYQSLPRQSRDNLHMTLERVLYNSKVDSNGRRICFRDYLDEYFAGHPEHNIVIFIGGKFRFGFRELDDFVEEGVERLARKLDSVPFICKRKLGDVDDKPILYENH